MSDQPAAETDVNPYSTFKGISRHPGGRLITDRPLAPWREGGKSKMFTGIHTYLRQMRVCLLCTERLCKHTTQGHKNAWPTSMVAHTTLWQTKGLILCPRRCNNECVTKGSTGLITNLIVQKQPLSWMVGWPFKGSVMAPAWEKLPAPLVTPQFMPHPWNFFFNIFIGV